MRSVTVIYSNKFIIEVFEKQDFVKTTRNKVDSDNGKHTLCMCRNGVKEVY